MRIWKRDIRYAGWQVCVDCHDVEGEINDASYHRTLPFVILYVLVEILPPWESAKAV